MKELYLDIGNSFLKMATRKKTDWQIVFDGEHTRLEELCRVIESAGDFKKVLVTSVRKDISQRLVQILPGVKIREYKTEDIPSKMLDYKTPNTLGLDRFLVCLGAAKESNGKDVIVIDAGSACTVDLMSKQKVYKGGVIMPGLSVIKSSMKNRLPELPVAMDSIPKTWPGKSTIDCIGWGVNGAFVHAIRGFINHYRSTLDTEMDIYVTGGDAKKIIEWMKEEEILIFNKNLLWEGMEEFERLLQAKSSSY